MKVVNSITKLARTIIIGGFIYGVYTFLLAGKWLEAIVFCVLAPGLTRVFKDANIDLELDELQAQRLKAYENKALVDGDTND